MISVWTGHEAHALREALRMSIDEFAGHLGVSRRAVARWRESGQQIRLRWDMQRTLDTALRQSPAEVKSRLEHLLTAPTADLLRPTHTHSRTARRPTHDSNVATPTTGPAVATPAYSPAACPPGHGQAAPMPWPGDVLSDVLVWPPEPTGARPPALIHLERRVARIWMSYQGGHYRRVTADLPALMQALTEAKADAKANFPLRVRRLTSGAHQVAACVLLKLGDVPMAMLAAERSAHEAAASTDPLVIAAAARIGAQVMSHGDHGERGAAVAMRAARTVKHATALDGPRPLSAYGALLLCAAVASARAGDRSGALSLLRDASVVAQRLGRNGNFGWTAFGPANVSLHEVSVLLALGDSAAAFKVCATVDLSELHQAERHASLHLYTATAGHRQGLPAAALSALERAFAAAPEEIRLRPGPRQLAADLAATARGPARTRATWLANEILTRHSPAGV